MSEMDLVLKWFKKSEDDLIVAKHSFEDIYPKQIEISCYHTQQAVEKTLKGYLLYNDVEPPKTHNLVVLCQMCMELDPAFNVIMDDCAVLTLYGSITRYPSEIELDEDEAISAIRKAEIICEFSVGLIPELKDLTNEQGRTLLM